MNAVHGAIATTVNNSASSDEMSRVRPEVVLAKIDVKFLSIGKPFYAIMVIVITLGQFKRHITNVS